MSLFVIIAVTFLAGSVVGGALVALAMRALSAHREPVVETFTELGVSR